MACCRGVVCLGPFAGPEVALQVRILPETRDKTHLWALEPGGRAAVSAGSQHTWTN